MGTLLSIVIPVYKVEKYLPECLDSILKQPLKDTEIIIVDDGSPDRCPEICDVYSKKYKQIRVFHKQNEGLSCARNTGLKEATGNYVWFIDSDDFLLDNALSDVYNAISNHKDVDIFSSGLMFYYDNDQRYAKEKVQYGLKTTSKGEYLWSHCPQGASPRFISKRQFLLNNDLFFQPGLLHEDGEWGYKTLYLADKVKILENPIYAYRRRTSGSIMSDIKIKSAYDLIKGHKLLMKFMNEKVEKEDKKRYICASWGMISAIDKFCANLYHTPEFEAFLSEHYPYMKKQAFVMVKANPIRIKSYIYLLHPYVRKPFLNIIRKIYSIKKNK